MRLAHNDERRKSASVLVERKYSWRGYETDDLNKNPNKITLVAHQEDKISGAVTLGLDSKAGLVVDELYKAEVDKLRAQGRKVAELTKLAVDESAASKSILAALFHIAFIYPRLSIRRNCRIRQAIWRAQLGLISNGYH